MTSAERRGAPDDAKRRLPGGRLLHNALALIISSGGTSILGVVFWGTAAHIAPASTIGRTSAEIAAMMLLATLAQLSFGTIFERFLPVAGHLTRDFVRRAYLMCIATALVFTTIYVAVGFSHSFLPSYWPWRALFIASVILWTLFMLQDSALIGLRSSKWVPVENILYAIAKLAILPLFVAFSRTQGIFLAWTIPVLLTIIIVAWYLFKRRIPAHQRASEATEDLPSTRELFYLAGAQYATLLTSVFAPSVVALIVIARLGPVANAHYYVPALISTGLSLFNWSIIKSFIVEATHEPWALRRHSNTAIKASIGILGGCVIVGVIFAPEFLRIFGSGYAAKGTTLLRMLLLSIPLGAVPIFYTAYAWIDKRVWWLSIREIFGTGIYFAILLLLIRRHGLTAIGIASLVSTGLQAAFFLPFAIRRYHATTDTELEAGTASDALN